MKFSPKWLGAIFTAFLFSGPSLAASLPLCKNVGKKAAEAPVDENWWGRGQAPEGYRPPPGVEDSLPGFPERHSEARYRLVEAERETLLNESNLLAEHFANEKQYDESRYFTALFKGVGAHTAMAEFGLSQATGGRYSALGVNKGRVVSEGVFGGEDPRNPHMTAERITVSEFPDNVHYLRAPPQNRFAKLPDGTYAPSAITGDLITHSLVRSPMNILMDSEVVRTVPREMVLEARRLVAAGTKGLSSDTIALSKEPGWPNNARFMHVAKVTGPDGVTRVERFFSDYTISATGLGRPKNPFPTGTAEHRLVAENFNRVRPGAPKGTDGPIHEASALFKATEAELERFAGIDGEIVAYGGGYSSIVALNRLLEINPNPKKPLRLITRRPFGKKDTVTEKYIRWANSDIFLLGVRSFETKPLGNGMVTVQFVDSSGRYYEFEAPESRLKIDKDRDHWGDELSTYSISVERTKKRIEHSVVGNSLKFDSVPGDPSRLNISFTEQNNQVRTITGRMFLGVGQEDITTHNSMWGPNVTAKEERLRGNVRFGFQPGQAPEEVDVARTITGLKWNAGTEQSPVWVDLALSEPVYQIGPGTRRQKGDVLIPQEILKKVFSPNTSADSLAALGGASHATGRHIGGLMVARKELGGVAPVPPPVRTTDLGPIHDAEGKPSHLFTMRPMVPPKHLVDFKGPDAVSPFMLSESVFAEAGRLFGGVRVSPALYEETNRVYLAFVREPQTGEIHIVIDRLHLGKEAYDKLESLIRNDKHFMEQIDAWLRRFESPLAMWLGFDRAGKFRPDLVRVSTPLEALAASHLSGSTPQETLELLPRQVEFHESQALQFIEANYRQLYEVRPDAEVKVEPPKEDDSSKKRFYVVWVKKPGSNKFVKDLVVSEYQHTDQYVGLDTIAGTQLFKQAGLSSLLANAPEKVAQALVGRRTTQKPELRLFVVHKVLNDGIPLEFDLTQVQAPGVAKNIALGFAEIHQKPSQLREPIGFSINAAVWISAQIDPYVGFHRGIARERQESMLALLSDPLWQKKMAHGDPRLGHIIPHVEGAKFAGLAEAAKGHHPLRDLQLFLNDLRINKPEYAAALATAQGPESFVENYSKAMGLTGQKAEDLRAWIKYWATGE